MNDPARLNLAGDRWVAFIREIPVLNADLTDATFAMQLRAVPDASGDPLVSLSTVTTASAEGVRVVSVEEATIAEHVTAGRLQSIPSAINPLTGAAYEGTDTVTLTVVGIRINETTMEGLPFPAERGDDAVLAWDLHVTPSGGTKQKFAGGTFTVRPGATQ